MQATRSDNRPHRLHRWLGVIAGFAGVLIIVRPGAQLDPAGVALGLLTALVFAAILAMFAYL